jgi:hypothetical protein
MGAVNDNGVALERLTSECWMVSDFNKEWGILSESRNGDFITESLLSGEANMNLLRMNLRNHWGMWRFNGQGSILQNINERLMTVPTAQADSERIFSKISGMYGYNKHS